MTHFNATCKYMEWLCQQIARSPVLTVLVSEAQSVAALLHCRATLIRELSPPSSPRSPGAAGSLHFGQEAEQCGDGRGSPLDSAYRSPSPGAGSLMGDEATSTSMGQMRQRRQQEQHHQGSGEASGHWAGPAAAAAADDLDSDSLLYSRRDMGAKGVAPEQPAAAGPAWLPMVTKEVLTVGAELEACQGLLNRFTASQVVQFSEAFIRKDCEQSESRAGQSNACCVDLRFHAHPLAWHFLRLCCAQHCLQ